MDNIKPLEDLELFNDSEFVTTIRRSHSFIL